MKKYFSYLFLFLALALSSCRTATIATEQAKESFLPVLQGVTTASTTELNVLSKDQDLKFFLKRSEKTFSPTKLQSFSRSYSPYRTYNMKFEGLEKGAEYVFEVQNAQGKILETRTLKTLDLSKPSARFILISCTDDSYMREQEVMWKDLISFAPEMIFSIGDNVYTDIKNRQVFARVTPEMLWNRYVETRLTLEIFRNKKLIPMLAIWDDHDYGQNDGDRTYEHRELATETFTAFYPQNYITSEFHKGPGVSSLLRAFQQNFFLLDGRSFRSPNMNSPACLKNPEFYICKKFAGFVADKPTHFGPDIESWFFGQLESIPANAFAWLMTGDQWFGAYSPFESYEGNSTEDFYRFIKKLKSVRQTFVFASGDRHLSELQRIEPSLLGYVSYEITSSAFHAKTYPSPWNDYPNSRQIAGRASLMNYSLVTSEVKNGKLQIDINAMGPNKEVLYNKKLSIKRW